MLHTIIQVVSLEKKLFTEEGGCSYGVLHDILSSMLFRTKNHFLLRENGIVAARISEYQASVYFLYAPYLLTRLSGNADLCVRY